MTDTEIQQGDKVSWNWGGGQPGGKVAEVKDQGEIAIESKRGNTIKKNASPDNPAVHVERSGNDVVKRANELQVDKKSEGTNGQQANGDAKKDDDKPAEAPKEDKPAEAEKKDEDTKDVPFNEKKKDDVQPNGSKEDEKEEPKEDAKTDDKSEEKAESNDIAAGEKRKVDDSNVDKTNGAESKVDEPATKKTKTDDAEGEGESKTKKAGRPKGSEKKKEPAKKKEPKKAATADGQPRRSGRNK